MKAKIYPQKVSGKVIIPPSKSMAHRAIICASLSQGTSIISNVDLSDDIKATIEAMEHLGALIKIEEDVLTIIGINSFDNYDGSIINCNESGSTLRFLIPIFSLCQKEVQFIGKNRLFKRPLTIYENIFAKQKLAFEQEENSLMIKGKLKGTHYKMAGNVSSQFISGLLFALPLLDTDSIIEVTFPFESRSYIDLTLQMLEKFKIKIVEEVRKDSICYFIKGQQKYLPLNYRVEGDYSQLAFFAVLAAINNDLELIGVDHDSKQGDKAILDFLKRAQIDIREIENGYLIKKGQPQGIVADIGDCPDLGPILTVLGIYSQNEFKLENCGRLRLKESDRILAMETGLKQLGANISSNVDSILIKPKSCYQGKAIVSGFKDHRIVMSLCVAATLCLEPVIVTEVEAINKSYPNFFKDLMSLGVKVEFYDN